MNLSRVRVLFMATVFFIRQNMKNCHNERVENLQYTFHRHLRSEVFTTAKVDKVFSGHQPCQLVKNHRRFRNHPCPHHQGLLFGTDMVPETSLIFTQLTRLLSREDFIIFNTVLIHYVSSSRRISFTNTE
jgi:hypothetical protein